VDQAAFDCHLAGRHIPQLISKRHPEKDASVGKTRLTQLFTLAYCEATRPGQLVNAPPPFFLDGITRIGFVLFFPPAWLRFWRRTAMRHGWASMFGIFLCGTASRLLTFINGILPFFSIFADSLDHKKKGKENLRTGGGKRWREVEKRPTNAVICAGGHGKRIGQNWCAGNGFDLCSCRIKRRRVWAWCWSWSWS